MTDYERDYTARLEKRPTRVQAECCKWRRLANRLLYLLVIACAGWLATAVFQ